MGVVGWMLPDWGRIRGVDVYHDKGRQQLAGRWLAEVAPCGVRPNYGDGAIFEQTALPLAALFERLASLTGDGRYKWAAHRLFEWATVNTRRRRHLRGWLPLPGRPPRADAADLPQGGRQLGQYLH
jgi:hypothetical protein